jgi:hypothetical protein
MQNRLTRRGFLALPIAFLGHFRNANAARNSRTEEDFKVDVAALYGLLSVALTGTVSQEIDSLGRRYRVVMEGQGVGAAHRTESVGILREGRCFPTESRLHQKIRGREATVSISYDYVRRIVEYHSFSQTLLLGRRRQVDDTLRLPDRQPVDDLASAYLNFAANKLDSDGPGRYHTLIVRRAWKENEGPDDVSSNGYRAMLAPVRLQVTPDPATGGLNGQLDMTSLSSWARAGQPARLIFDQHRHLQSFQSALILGTTVTVRLTSGA